MCVKISELKLKLSTAGTQLNFGAQELFIQQLQDEIKRLSDVNQQLQVRARQMHHQLMRQREDYVQTLTTTTSARNQQLRNISHQQHVPTEDDSCALSSSSSGGSSNHQRDVDNLRVKLKTAAKYITHLIREKEHLIEMSNRLRGELNRIKCKRTS